MSRFIQLADVKLDLKLGRVIMGLERIAKADMRRAFNELKGPARFDQRHHERHEEAPDGKWPPLAASTVARRARIQAKKKRRARVTNKLLGRLPGALMMRATARSLQILSRVTRWSMAHQKGAVVGHGARLPRRQFLWISDWLKGRARHVFELELLKAWERR